MMESDSEVHTVRPDQAEIGEACLHIKVPEIPPESHLWKENEESNTVRPKTLVDLNTDRLGAPYTHQERRQSYSKV